MSHRATAWAIAQRTGSPTRKAVLVALADRHNDDTGRCFPSVRRLAEDTEFSERSVQRALAELEGMGYIVRGERLREDGSRSTDEFTFPSLSGEGVRESPPAPVRESPLELEVQNLPSTSVANAPSVDGPKSVNRKATTDLERHRARQILRRWNEAAGQDLRADDWLAKIIMRLREYPEATLADHSLIIETALANPWWQGPPSPSVVYGNGAQFERSIAAVRQSQTVSEEIKSALDAMRRSRERRRAG